MKQATIAAVIARDAFVGCRLYISPNLRGLRQPKTKQANLSHKPGPVVAH